MVYVYVISSKKDKKWYTGSTTDLRKRFNEHNEGKVVSTKGRGSFELIYYEACVNINDAFTREGYLKTGMGKRYLKNRLKRFLSLTGQSLTELALLFTMVVVSIMMMRLYTQRYLQAKYRAGADYLVSEIKSTAVNKSVNGFSGMNYQYDPYYRESNITERKAANYTTGFPGTSINQTTNRTGQEKTGSALDAG